MRRVTLMLAAMALMVGLFAGVAYAATIEGNVDPEILIDGNLDDTIFGRGGGDEIRADAFGPQGFLLDTPRDTDEANGNAGDDLIVTDDGDGRDTANGGNGDDICVIDANDTATSSCEDVFEDPPLTSTITSRLE
jgi:Ca2+-binding RTX toxin-like protein